LFQSGLTTVKTVLRTAGCGSIDGVSSREGIENNAGFEVSGVIRSWSGRMAEGSGDWEAFHSSWARGSAPSARQRERVRWAIPSWPFCRPKARCGRDILSKRKVCTRRVGGTAAGQAEQL